MDIVEDGQGTNFLVLLEMDAMFRRSISGRANGCLRHLLLFAIEWVAGCFGTLTCTSDKKDRGREGKEVPSYVFVYLVYPRSHGTEFGKAKVKDLHLPGVTDVFSRSQLNMAQTELHWQQVC